MMKDKFLCAFLLTAGAVWYMLFAKSKNGTEALMDEIMKGILSEDTRDMPLSYRYKDYTSRMVWDEYSLQLKNEYEQCEGEGLDVERLKASFEAVRALENGAFKALASDRLFAAIMKLPLRADFPYVEPNELNDIRAARPAHTAAGKSVDRATLRDRLAGAWYGRIAGCLLGKTVEGIRTEELLPFLKESGNFPMHRYIVSGDVPEDAEGRYRFGFKRACFADKLKNAPADDDTNYTCLYQKLIERSGRDFTSDDVCSLWQLFQPKTAYCTAERVAYLNIVKGMKPPACAIYENPYREWIGAQIRADYFGYINPGDPETAAEMAWRDARISHVKNGIYGEMLVAAMIAAAATESDLEKIIEAGLNEIPEKSRLQCEIRALIAKYHSNASEDELFAWIHTLYDEHSEYGWCHTNANALIVCASMLVTGGDYSRAICRAVQTGFDTDCNGATVGSILGMRGGLKCIDEKWLKPLHGALDTSIVRMGTVKIDELIDKTLSHIVTA